MVELLKKGNQKIKQTMSSFAKRKYANFLLIFLFAMAINMFLFVLQLTELKYTMEKLFQRPMVLLLNFIPIFLLIVLLYGITSSVGWSVKIGYFLMVTLAIVNRTKLIYRDEPLTAFDMFLGMEAFTMSVKSNYLPERLPVILMVIGLLMLFVFFHFYSEKKMNLKKRVILVVFVVFLSGLLYQTVYSNDAINAKLPVDGSIFNEKDNYNSKGVVYSVIRSFSNIFVEVPQKYQVKEFKTEKKNSVVSGKAMPNVVMIMAEAFHDISELPMFEFEKSPVANFNKIAKESLLHGRLMTPTFAGGTADTEFEVLSGAMTDRIAPNKSFSYNAVNFEVDSVVRTFLEAGYYTRAFHPGEPWFYKRSTVYPRLGFMESFFLPSVENPHFKGSYLSENQTYDIFINRLDEDVKKREEPVFDFMVTIQNHGPYFKGKFAEFYPFKTSKPISQELKESLEIYFEGVKDMDVNLNRIYEYMKESDEPFVLVFWGDHLPGLVDSVSYYGELDFDMNTETYGGETRFYSTPYLVWANEKAKAMMQKPEQPEQTISSNYLGGYTLEMLGFDKNDPYFEFLNQLRTKLPVLSRHFVFDGKDAYLRKDYKGEFNEDLEKYYRWQYYRMTEPYQQRIKE